MHVTIKILLYIVDKRKYTISNELNQLLDEIFDQSYIIKNKGELNYTVL